MGRRLDPNRLITVLGVAVLLLGAVSVYVFSRGEGLGMQPSPSERARQQLREALGRDVELQYVEEGEGAVLCGYADGVTMFISRPNRLLLSTDPLLSEFEQMMGQACPGFARPIPTRVTP